MIVSYFRSSLLNCFSLCPHLSFIEYNLGIKSPPNKSALIGSAVHGVLELLALAKLYQQNGRLSFEHDSFGPFLTILCLKSDSPGELLKHVYDYYDEESPGIFDDNSYDECIGLIDKALSFKNGIYDPRNNSIHAAELPFDITLEYDWASYTYNSPDGLIKGNLALKGTIDLVLEEDDNTLLCLDYKTGKTTSDWATGKDKDSKSLKYDPQLMLYYYVLSELFPNKIVLMSLYFVRLDKVFTVAFDEKDKSRIRDWIRERFEHIKSVERPAIIDGTADGWKCFRFCPHFKNKQAGSRKSVCRFFQDEIKNKGMERTLLEHANFKTISSYGSGGSQKNRK